MIRVGIYRIDEVLPYTIFQTKTQVTRIRNETENQDYSKREYNGLKVNMHSQRYQLFATKGIVCIKCGVKGEYFALESHYPKSDGFHSNLHFNLYGHDKEGKEVLLTKDHKTPKSDGGKNHIDNYQVMCLNCNNRLCTIINPIFVHLLFPHKNSSRNLCQVQHFLESKRISYGISILSKSH